MNDTNETYVKPKKPELVRVQTQLVFSPEEHREIDTFLVSTGRVKGRCYVEAMKLYIERERKAGRYPAKIAEIPPIADKATFARVAEELRVK
jgi:hypothetical protein